MSEDLLNRLQGLRPGQESPRGSAGALSQELLAQLDLGVLLVDPSGVVRIGNSIAAGLLGVAEGTLEGSSVFEPAWVAVKEDGSPREGGEQPFARALRTGEAVRDEWLAVRRATPGGPRWLRVSAIPLHDEQGILREWLCSLRDVTSERHAARDSARDHALLAQVMATSVAGLCVLETSGDISYANRAAEEILGLSRDEITARRYDSPQWRSTTLDGEEMPDEEQPFVRVMTTKAPVHDVRHVILWPNGTRKVLSINGAPVLDARGEVERLVFAIVDVTEQAREESERERMQSEMEQLARLESLSVLAAGVAHDFNNILVGMLGGAELVRESVDDGHPAGPAIELLEQGALRASELTHQLLAFSGKSRFIVGPRDLSQVVRETSQLLRALISRDAHLVFALADDLPTVEVDGTQVRQVLMNMVLNASQAMSPTGGEILVGTAVRHVDEAFLRDSVQSSDRMEAGEYVVLEVADDGRGMDSAVAARVFEPFFTTKNDGHGLGLAAVMGVIRSHGGFVNLKSAPGNGTRFLLGFPVAAKSSVPTEPPQPTNEPFRGTVLVIDDENFVRLVTRRILECEGCTVHCAENGAGGLATYRRHRSEIDAVVLDLTMPGMTGESVLAELRALDPALPVVVTSGFTDDSRFQGDPATRFLAKPFGRADLLSALANVRS